MLPLGQVNEIIPRVGVGMLWMLNRSNGPLNLIPMVHLDGVPLVQNDKVMKIVAPLLFSYDRIPGNEFNSRWTTE